MVFSRLLTVSLVITACSALAAAPVDELAASSRRALERGENDEAMALAGKAVEADGTSPAGYLARAAVHDARGGFQKAVADCGKGIELSPKSAAAYQRRGEDQVPLGHFNESGA